MGTLVERLHAGEQGVLVEGEGAPGGFRVAWAPTGADTGSFSRLEQLAAGHLRPRRPRSAPGAVAFAFPGQGSQRPSAAAWWIERPAFRHALQACAEVLDPRLPRSLEELLLDPAADLSHTAVTQPTLVAFCVALCAQWRAWGVEPSWVFGHSLGEHTAAWAAGCCSRRELLELVAERGRVMAGLPEGDMAVVFAAPARVARALADLGGHAWVAADNGVRDSVIAGAPFAVRRALRLLELEGIETRRLQVSFAAHGPAVEPALEAYALATKRVAWSAPRSGWISTHTPGSQVAPPSAAYWCAQTRGPVRFRSALRALRERRVEVVLELGPGGGLARLAEQELPTTLCMTSAAGDEDPAQHVLQISAALWERGVEVDWEALRAAL